MQLTSKGVGVKSNLANTLKKPAYKTVSGEDELDPSSLFSILARGDR